MVCLGKRARFFRDGAGRQESQDTLDLASVEFAQNEIGHTLGDELDEPYFAAAPKCPMGFLDRLNVPLDRLAERLDSAGCQRLG